jgi:hypothetical protein
MAIAYKFIDKYKVQEIDDNNISRFGIKLVIKTI